jgi:hypothetical protein
VVTSGGPPGPSPMNKSTARNNARKATLDVDDEHDDRKSFEAWSPMVRNGTLAKLQK